MDSAPTPSFPFTDSPLRPGCTTPNPRFTRPTPPTCPPPLCADGRGAARTVRQPPHFRSRTVPSALVAPPSPLVYALHPAHTPSTPLHARRGHSTDSAPPPSFPFADNPLRLGCSTPHPQFTHPASPAHPPRLCAHAGGAGWTVRLPLFSGGGDCPHLPFAGSPPRPPSRLRACQGRRRHSAPTFPPVAVPSARATPSPPGLRALPLCARMPRDGAPLRAVPSPSPHWCLRRHAVD